MVGGEHHLAFCTLCDPPTLTTFNTHHEVESWRREHQRLHIKTVHYRSSTITVLYDSRDPTDPWLSTLLNWRVDFAHKEENDE